MKELSPIGAADPCVETVLGDDMPGDLVECGMWRGGCILMREVVAAFSA
jgi:O-methyltransferase